MKIFQFFDQNYGNSNILTFSQMYFYSLKSFLFYLEYRNHVFFQAYFTLGSKNIKSGLACTAGVESGRGQGRREKGGGGGGRLPISLFWFYRFGGGGKWRHRIGGKNLFFLIGKTGLVVLKEHLAIESKVKKKFKKLILFKRYEALKCHIFLKIITKIAEI